MGMMVSNLPSELVEEIISRVPIKAMRIVRSTCKNWNSLFTDESFVKKHVGQAAASTKEREFLMITRDHRVELISVNLNENHNNNNDFDQSINRKGTLISREYSDPILFISQVFQCSGLVLCVFKNIYNRLAVWNPYWGKRRWIEGPKNDLRLVERFAFGYDKSCGSYKILVIFYNDNQLEIYDLSSNSWRLSSATLDRDIVMKRGIHGVSLKGNTYWYEEKGLLCFDFTRERFGPHLPLPFDYSYEWNVSLSTVREEQLALLMKPWGTSETKVWVTNKIEPDVVSWTSFLNVDIKPHAYILGFQTFFIEERNIVVFSCESKNYQICNIAYITGENGYFRRVDLGMSGNIQLHQFVYSYAPTSLQIK